MNKLILLIAVSSLGWSMPNTSRAQTTEVKQLLLNVEKLSQLKNILRDMKQGYEILRSGYQAISDISQGNFRLHETFLDELYRVSPLVRDYARIGEILRDGRTIQTLGRSIAQDFRRAAPDDLPAQRYVERVLSSLSK
ncbi:MAG: TerB family tellurite resistance protein, partial [Mucilaginibacter polytrichastri]|nr:TerB family tellurite resistance protein [Mucilaginibacter polytrichastri]